MGMRQCSNGHIYDDGRSGICPYCGSVPEEQDKNIAGIEEAFPGYKVDSRIGKGSTGTVYLVKKVTKKAVKVIDCGRDVYLLENAKREFEFMHKASSCSAVIHGDDIKITETQDGYKVYILQEYATPFFEHYKNNIPGFPEIRKVMLEVCKAVNQLKYIGIVHLDIKPDNIFIADNGAIKLGDFSHMAYVSELSSINKAIGSPQYMAPEIFEGKGYNDVSVVYSLGIVLYCIITQKFPFDFSDRDLKVRRKEDKYIEGTIDGGLMEVIKKATAYNPGDRYCSVVEFSAALDDEFEMAVLFNRCSGTPVCDRMKSEVRYSLAEYMDDSEGNITDIPAESVWEDIDNAAYTCAFPLLDDGEPDAWVIKAGNTVENPGPTVKAADVTKKGILGRVFGRKDKKAKLQEDLVQFSAAAPSTFKRNGYTLLKIMMHHENDYERVDREIKKLGRKTVQSSSGIFGFNRGEKFRIVLQSPDVIVDDNIRDVVWNGIFAECTYSVFLPEDYQKEQIAFKGRVYKGDAVITDIILVASVEAKTDQVIIVEKCELRSAFVSYASQDRTKVIARIQGIQAARRDLDLFLDVENLRCGEKWEDRLYSEIEKRNVFYLFWSRNASKSEWVKKELGYAIEVKGVDCVEPIPLEAPDVCPPPDELKEKHFNDWTLRYLGE